MEQLKEYRYIIVTIFAIFAILLVGAYYSDSFSQRLNYLELFTLLGSLLFVFSMLVVFAILGFESFAIYMAIFISVVMLMYGILGVILVASMTYLAWGVVFSIELLLVYHDVPSAIDWFRDRYDFDSFRVEYYAFYPMTILLYLLIELLPNVWNGEKIERFSPHQIFEKMRDLFLSQ
ncbi:hypothetical protein MNB_SV-6-929 [hydrothermal vent metagenome]|uniref:Uncharacterized protein n=1 Tax=hydrothermal vent metagenome TaxID=652676 RepID=A0A1W1C5Y6_9ZZZZ